MTITITEALAEIKTVNKRVASKKTFILDYLSRLEGVKDPLDKDGGSYQAIKRERQAVADLEKRVVTLRRGIQRANDATVVSLEGMTMPISDWLAWRRDVAPERKVFLADIRKKLTLVREQAKRNGATAISPGGSAEKATDVIINIDEQQLATDIEQLENVLGQLDGQLSLKNATTFIVEA